MINVFQYSNSLNDMEDRIWHVNKTGKVSYPCDGNDNCFKIEDKSFWFEHRNDCILQLVNKFPPKGRGPIFDIGGGNGFVAKGLMAAGWEVVLVEPGLSGVQNARKRGVEHIICGSLSSVQFKKSSLPSVGLFDVVEHIDDDENFLKEIHYILEPEGLVYITVPAFSVLWSHTDVCAGHFRRYSIREIKNKLNNAGFSLIYGTYIFRFLVLPVFLLRALPYRLRFSEKKMLKKAQVEHVQDKGILAKLLKRSFDSELKKISLSKVSSFGGSCLLVAQNKQSIKNKKETKDY